MHTRQLSGWLRLTTLVLAPLAAGWLAINLILPLGGQRFRDMDNEWQIVTIAGVILIVLLLLETLAVLRPPVLRVAVPLAVGVLVSCGTCWALFTVANAIYVLTLTATVAFVGAAALSDHRQNNQKASSRLPR
ncbi:hypothetical protein [Lacticaseibacillus daqingensis]|uniref:hypothetical protein n=1 Tax=Lacticaseibacillus daqingensis TaxID=2486014 RepID=UPI000F7A44B3|nr:hypothetical protein [Lacticaseibacillus daqingensis]